MGTFSILGCQGLDRGSFIEWPRRGNGAHDGETSMTAANDLAVRRALEMAGVEFIDENGGGPGVRLRKRQQPK